MVAISSFFCRYTLALLILAVCFPAWADQGKELFDKQCAGCHTIGGGDSGGPDLKGVTSKRPHEWLESVIMEPNKLTTAKDPVQMELIKKYGFEMPDLGIGHEDALKIIEHLKGGAGATTGTAPLEEQAVIQVTPELLALGKALFAGERRLSKGGAPCLGCHPFASASVVGGNLSKADLVRSYEKMGEQGMRGALKALKFPTMKRIYLDRPLSDEEIAALIAFIKNASEKKEPAKGEFAAKAGAGLFFCLLVGLSLYRRRLRNVE